MFIIVHFIFLITFILEKWNLIAAVDLNWSIVNLDSEKQWQKVSIAKSENLKRIYTTLLMHIFKSDNSYKKNKPPQKYGSLFIYI